MDIRQALKELDQAQRTLDGAPLPARAAFLYWLAMLLSLSGAVADAEQRLAEAETLRATLSDPQLDALGLSVVSRHMLGDLAHAGGPSFQAPSDAGIFSARPPVGSRRCRVQAGLGEIDRGALDEATALVDDLQPRAARIGHHGAEWTLRETRWALALMSGDLTGAERESARSSRVRQDARHPVVCS